MEYKRKNNDIIVRMDPNEEILEQLKTVAEKENVKLAEVSAIGAVKEFTVGVYDLAEKKFVGNHFAGTYEIVSLTGNISTMNNQYYGHLHFSAADEKGHVFGGHLNSAIVSATCEMFIRIIDEQIDRIKDENTGLNIFSFAEIG